MTLLHRDHHVHVRVRGCARVLRSFVIYKGHKPRRLCAFRTYCRKMYLVEINSIYHKMKRYFKRLCHTRGRWNLRVTLCCSPSTTGGAVLYLSQTQGVDLDLSPVAESFPRRTWSLNSFAVESFKRAILSASFNWWQWLLAWNLRTNPRKIPAMLKPKRVSTVSSYRFRAKLQWNLQMTFESHLRISD